jgi:hypothetical protein
MSWSRYHTLSWTFTRARSRFRARRARRLVKAVIADTPVSRTGCSDRRRAGKSLDGSLDDSLGSGEARGFLARTLRAVMTIFRTGVVPRDTDI